MVLRGDNGKSQWVGNGNNGEWWQWQVESSEDDRCYWVVMIESGKE